MLKKAVLILMALTLSQALHDYKLKECDVKNFESKIFSKNELMFKTCIIPMNNISKTKMT